jgi:hypothetical protein
MLILCDNRQALAKSSRAALSVTRRELPMEPFDAAMLCIAILEFLLKVVKLILETRRERMKKKKR